jgi:hypothetical protein
MEFQNRVKVNEFDGSRVPEIKGKHQKFADGAFSQIKVFCLLIFIVYSFIGCQLEVNTSKINSSHGSSPSPIEDSNPSFKMSPSVSDFVFGEIVTTPSGAVIKGTFGEISERQVLFNGTIIEGAFYE